MKFIVETLGCKVNVYESNVMISLLEQAGYKQCEVGEIADIVIVNTCTVTNKADSKSLKLVRQLIRKYPNAYLIVVGCSSQNNASKFIEITGVDLVLGNADKSKIVDYIKQQKKGVFIQDIAKQPFEDMKIKRFNQTRAYVKIEDGCNNFCSYCIIPYVRGEIRSKPLNEVITEIKTLVKEGYKEIVLTGIHTGHYGADLKISFATLLKNIVLIPHLERIRISSIEITELTDEVLELFKKYDILVDHLHIPLQSGSDTVLKRMNRKYDTKYFIDKVNKIRKIRPLISLTTDVITGFPGETEEEFNETIETINKIKFSKIHVFPYSIRKGTKAALMDNQIPENVKKKRVDILLKLSEELEKEYFSKFINKEVIFLPEIERNGYIIGHTGNYLLIKIKGDKSECNHDIKVKITEMQYPYLIGNKIDIS